MNRFKIMMAGLGITLFFASCDHPVSMQTTVHPDGALDKTITIFADSAAVGTNFLGISSKDGWQTELIKGDSTNEDRDKLYIRFLKHFNSSEEANQALAARPDTLFHVTSHFEKKFRWFYTYWYYSDTYQAINRLALPVGDYFSPEDFAFIDRLPPEGKPISKADSLYLDQLHEKIFDVYGSRALFDNLYEKLVAHLKEQNHGPWIDSLASYKEELYGRFMDEGEKGDSIIFAKLVYTPGFPLTKAELHEMEEETDRLVNFFSTASNGKYFHQINMPGTVVNSNADSLMQSSLFWRPNTTRFLLKDYTMFAESRKLNGWTVIVSGILVALAIGMNFYRKTR